MKPLSPKLKTVLRLISKGMTNLQIANKIGTSEFTVKNQVKRLLDLTGTWSRLELALWHLGHK